MSSDTTRLHFMRLALKEAEKCEPTSTAFCVGCVLVPEWGQSEEDILAMGYSRELPGNTHAEANALANARTVSTNVLQSKFSGHFEGAIDVSTLLQHTDVYTTMEPCSIRTSGLAPCADALINAKVKRCYIGVSEPDDFVNCEGAMKLIQSGIEVQWIPGLEDDCLRVARRGHAPP